MAEFFFTAALAAGFIEGCSVVNYSNKRQDDARRRSTPLLLVPSILYSTAALPMGIIGASPGPSLVAWFPFAPSILESGGKKVSLTKPELSTAKDATHFEAIIPNTLGESETEDEHHPIMSRHDLVRKMREDNKRALLAMQQHKQTESLVAEQRRQPRVVPQTRAPRKLISTLDGHSLSTPLAEAMRRARFLCIGAGLVLTVASYEQARQQELEREREIQREQQRNGRDAKAIQTFVKENGCKNGSVVRLVSSSDSIREVARSKGVIPLVYGHSVPSSRLNASNKHETDSRSKQVPFWNLGTTPQEWRQTPLTKDWLFQTSDVGGGSLVLEADLSCDSLSEYLSQQDIPTVQSMENSRWVSKILGMIVQQNGVVYPSGGNVDDENASSVTVLIGNGKRPLELSEIDNVIYIDGLASVAAKVYAVLETMNSKPCPDDKLEAEPTPDDEGDQKGFLISALDYVGMKLRQGGTHVVTAIGGIFSRRREEKNVYVLSDHSFAPLWVRKVMPYEWTVIAFDALDNVEAIREMEDDGVTFVCCQTDEATSAIVCSLLLNGAGVNRLVALVQEESCASSLRDLATDLKKETNFDIVSVKGVHADLFGQARELLSSGKSPEKVQDSMRVSW